MMRIGLSGNSAAAGATAAMAKTGARNAPNHADLNCIGPLIVTAASLIHTSIDVSFPRHEGDFSQPPRRADGVAGRRPDRAGQDLRRNPRAAGRRSRSETEFPAGAGRRPCLEPGGGTRTRDAEGAAAGSAWL